MSRIGAVVVVLIVSLWPIIASAQLYDPWHRPVGVDYRYFPTEHFDVIYQRGHGDDAAHLAGLLEWQVPRVRAFVGLRRPLDVPLVLNDFRDRANGFVTPLPFRQEIDATPIRGHDLSPRLHGWFETVGPHELVHAAHAESGTGVGVGWILRHLGPDLARTLNLSGPRGINEGLAVYYESRLRPHAGRLNHSLFRMELRAAMESDDPWSLTQMLEQPAYTRPFDRYYHGGGMLFEFLASEGEPSFFQKARDFYYRFPLLGYGPALWLSTGETPHATGRRIRRHYRLEATEARAALGDPTSPDVVASEVGRVHRRPRWLNDQTIVAYSHGYHLQAGFYRFDADSGERDRLATASITEDYNYTIDAANGAVLFSRYRPDPLEAISGSADIHRISMHRDESNRLTDGARLFAPVRTTNGELWALQNRGPSNAWVAMDAEGSIETLYADGISKLLAVEPDPVTADATVLLNRQGRQSIYLADISNREAVRLEPFLGFESASIYDMSWSEDGRFLLFSADPAGISNVFVWERDTDVVYQLTNVVYGALEPALSPDGTKVAFIHFRHQRYDLVTVPFDLSSAQRWDRRDVAYHTAGSSSPTETLDYEPADTSAVRAYSGVLGVRPRVLFPFLLYQRTGRGPSDVSLGWGGGLGIEWADPLQYVSGHTHVFYQHRQVWGRALVRAGGPLLRPSAEVYREPSTVVVRRTSTAGVDTVRLGRDERGVGMALRLPALLESNVYQTSATGVLGAELRGDRLFDVEGRTVRAMERRVTLRPSGSLGYRLLSNPRDLMPSSGFSLSAVSAVDVWTERNLRASWLRTDASAFLPLFSNSSTGVKLSVAVLTQNRGGLIDLASFLPRGYETETVFLGGGSFLKSGMEVTRPLWYVDDGFLLFPLYVKAIYAYGFIESLDGPAVERLSVAGAGLGVELRLFHSFDVAIRWAPVYRFSSGDWSMTYR